MFCEKQIENYLEIDKCNIQSISYKFPFAITFKNIKLEENVTEQKTAIEIAELILKSKVRGLGKKFNMEGTIYGGSFQSDLNIQYDGKHFLMENIGLSGLQVENLMDSLQLSERKTKGNMNFKGMYKAPFYQPFDGQGEGNVEISSGSFQLSQPILGLSNIPFNTLQFHMAQDNELIKLDDGSLESEVLKASFTGDVILKELRLDSHLKLIGTMEPSKTLTTQDPGMERYVKRLARRYNMKTLPFRIGGTIKTPTFRFGR